MKESIFYQSKILNCGFVACNNHVQVPFSDQLFNSENTDIKKSSKLSEYALKIGRTRFEEQIKDKVENQDFKSIDDIKEFCESLPNEWTVLQICKDHDKSTTFACKDRIVSSTQPIYISVLKHARSSEYPDPICFRIDASVDKMSEYLFSAWFF